MTTLTSFNMINVGSLQNDSGVFIGQNNQPGWDSHQKQNSANLMYGFFNTYPGNLNAISDNDAIDSPINDQDIKGGSTLQGV